MHTAHLRGLDLNLLVILDALLRERSVTRAARRLAMTQPAVSHALRRLRALFDDPLFDRRGHAMRPTPRAEALAEPLREVLDGVRRITDATPPALEEIERTIRISLVDFAIAGLLPPLLAETSRRAPGLTLACVAWSTADKDAQSLQRDACDLVLGSFGPLRADLVRCPLGDVPFVGVARADHPMFHETRPRPHDHGFIVVSMTGETKTPLDAALPEPRRVMASLPGFMGVPPVVAASDLLAYVPAPVANIWTELADLRTFEAPEQLPPQAVELAWHRRFDDDVAHRFVRDHLATWTRRILRSPPATRYTTPRP